MREHLLLGLLPILFLTVLVTGAVANDEVARDAWDGYVSKVVSSSDTATSTEPARIRVAGDRSTISDPDSGRTCMGYGYNDSAGRYASNDGDGNIPMFSRERNGSQQGGNGNSYGDTTRSRMQNRDGSCDGTAQQIRQRDRDRSRSRDGSGGGNGYGNGNGNRQSGRGGQGYFSRNGRGWNDDTAPGYWQSGNGYVVVEVMEAATVTATATAVVSTGGVEAATVTATDEVAQGKPRKNPWM
jgi:hypothetical protein